MLSDGNTAWILTSTALVLFMTLPGLALFYGGLVHNKNIISVLMHCFAIACMVSVLWLAGVYSLAFGDGGAANAWIGSLDKAFLAGVGTDTLSGNIPETVFFMFQMTFAIITPALIVGAYVERIKFTAVMLFSGLWLILVYAPVAHWVWGGGWLAEMGVQDFAGGLVVHLTCGVSAIVAALVLGKRTGFPRDIKPPHSPVLVMIGASMLWVGWYGFNAGSALAADGAAGMAMTVTHISAATAACVWIIIESIKYGKPTLVGIATGAIAGLATITPASGFVGPSGGFIIGLVAGTICFYAVNLIRGKMQIDDSLDVLAVHGVGGLTGILLTAFLGAKSLGGLGLSENTIGGQFVVQLTGAAATLVWTAVVTYILLIVVRALVGLRVSQEEEIEGLDLNTHGEKGYDFT
ncbi:MAG: ammonium transporter [Rhodospirillales bacterium]|nr:ammonium transporter [Rhodospirillales bacterium]